MEGLHNTGGRARSFCLSLFICSLVIFSSGTTIVADQNNEKPSKAVPGKRKSSHPYCGMYCLYTAIRLAGQEVDFRELLKPEYIGSRKGSSLAELKKAAQHNGLHAVPVGKLTSTELRKSVYPIILHVKSDIMSKTYDHYELFLGTEDGNAKLFDPPTPARSVPFRELAPRWDGNGLIVSAEPIDLGAIFAPARKRFVMYAAVAVAIVLAVHWARRRWLPDTIFNSRRKLLGLSSAEGSAFAIAAVLIGMLYHFANDEGFLANANATTSIQQAHLASFIPKVSEKEVGKLFNSDAVFVDARLARDFKKGHLAGAINVPVDANDTRYQAATADIAKDAHIVVYCQSAGCEFAEKVAVKLVEDGFSNISIFRGVWHKWVAKNDKQNDISL